MPDKSHFVTSSSVEGSGLIGSTIHFQYANIVKQSFFFFNVWKPKNEITILEKQIWGWKLLDLFIAAVKGKDIRSQCTSHTDI